MATLRATLGVSSWTAVTDTNSDIGTLYKVDNESIRVMGTYQNVPVPGTAPTTDWYWVVQRGRGGTTVATHSQGATLTAFDPESGSTSGGGPHTHPESDVTSLTSDLAAKSSTSHNHDSAYAPTHSHPYAATSHAHVDGDLPAGLARDSEVTQAVSDHAGLADPHTGYRLESADHSHATTGLQAGTVAHSVLTSISATDHHVAPAAGPDANVTVDAAGAAGAAGTFARSGHGHQVVTYAPTPASIGTGAAGTSGTAPARGDHVHATGAGTPSTQAFGDAAATGSGPTAAMTDHKHAFPALGTTPSTQAFGDAAAGGSATAPSKNDHKHAMPTLGYGLSGNSAPAVGLSQTSAFATATTSVSAATYADVTGVSISLAAGTWLVMAQCTGSSVNAQAVMHIAVTDAANAIVTEGSQGIGASGTASVAQLGSVSLMAIVVSAGTTYKLRAARGLTTITGTWTAMDGAGTNTTNNLTDNSDKGTGIFAIRLA